MMKFSQRVMTQIRDTMHAKNISQRELADALRMSDASVSQMLNERSNLTLKTVDRIHAAMLDILNRRPPNNFIFVDGEGLKR